MNELERQALLFEGQLERKDQRTVLWKELLAQRKVHRDQLNWDAQPRRVEGLMVFMPTSASLHNPRLTAPVPALVQQKRRIERLLSPRLSDKQRAEMYRSEYGANFRPQPPSGPPVAWGPSNRPQTGRGNRRAVPAHRLTVGSNVVAPSSTAARVTSARVSGARASRVRSARNGAAVDLSAAQHKPAPPPVEQAPPAIATPRDADPSLRLKLEAFKALDRHGNSQLSFQEFVKACYIFGKHMCKTKMHQTFERIDADGSGLISFDEFLASGMVNWSEEERGQLQAQRQGQERGQLQAQRQGQQRETTMELRERRRHEAGMAIEVAKAKVREVMKGSGSAAQAMYRAFVQFDKDGSGQLSYGECIDALQSLGIRANAGIMHRVLAEFDDDGSGQVSYGEFVEELAKGQKSGIGVYKPVTKTTIM